MQLWADGETEREEAEIYLLFGHKGGAPATATGHRTRLGPEYDEVLLSVSYKHPAYVH